MGQRAIYTEVFGLTGVRVTQENIKEDQTENRLGGKSDNQSNLGYGETPAMEQPAGLGCAHMLGVCRY